jgi:hypothetical protein
LAVFSLGLMTAKNTTPNITSDATNPAIATRQLPVTMTIVLLPFE